MRPAGLRAIAAPAAVYAIQFVSVGAWTAYSTVYFAELGIDLALVGILASMPAAAIAGGPLWGIVADRLGDVRPPYLAASLLAAGASLVLAAGPPIGVVAAAVLVFSAGTSGMLPLLDARTVERLGPDRHRYGQARAFGSLSFVLGSVLVGWLAARSGVGSLFALSVPSLALAGCAAVLLLGRAPRPRVGDPDPGAAPGDRGAGTAPAAAPPGPREPAGPPALRPGPRAALRLLREPGLGLLFAGLVVAWSSAVGVMTFLALRVLDVGGDAPLVGLAWGITALSEIPLMLLFARLARRTGIPVLVTAGLVLFAVRAGCWAVATTPLAIVVTAPLGGLAFSLMLVGVTMWVAERVPPELRATAQALFTGATFGLGSVAGSLAAGAVASRYGLGAIFPAATLVSAVAVLLVRYALARAARR